MATIYPPAKWLEVSGEQNDPPIQPIGVILHVDGGNAGSLFNYFDGPSRGVESHLFIRKDGQIEQYRDLDHEADANWMGNSWDEGGKRLGFLSVETQGLAEGEWTDEQLAGIKAFLLWASNRYGFPLRVAPAYRSPGVGYHVMFGAGTDTSWSNARGKVCPGPDRIRQFHDVLVPWMANPEEDMPLSDDDVQRIARAVVQYRLKDPLNPSETRMVGTMWQDARKDADQANATARRLSSDVDELKAQVAALQPKA